MVFVFIHELFERVVKNSLKETAVRCGDKELTYDQLNKISNKIGWYLVNKGVKSEESVAIIMERSVEMIAAIIGVLKAGGCYVPIEPNCPGDRLKFILEDAQVGIVLTQNSLIDKFISYNGEIITSDSYLFYEEKDHNLSTIMYADNLAYIIYTSGSTGTPKGVMGTHENLVQSLISRTNYYKEDKIRSLLVVPVSFDSSITAIFWPLITGGSVTIVPQIEYLDLEQLLYIIKNNSISHFPCPPALYLSLLETGSSKLKNLQVVVVAGERCPERILELHFELLSNTLLSNEYGPTEVSVWSSASSIYDNERKYKVDKITIGKQRTNVELFILDEKIRILPIGVKGEIYIGGKGLARGYINRADLTAERFIANPFGNGERLYKTGDIGRYLYDGNIEYLGRSDEQVKIRGYRIELGEIESNLNEFQGIRQSVVTVKEKNSNKYLIGYCVSDKKLDSAKIISYLESKIPEYMIPKYFVYIDKIPLTINGKLDKSALPEPEINSENYVEARNELEVKVRKIWFELLSFAKDKISITDDFFRLGGDSIVSIQLVSKLRQELGLTVSIKDIFKHRTIQKLFDNVLSKSLVKKVNLKAEFSDIANIISQQYLDKIQGDKEVQGVYLANSLQQGLIYHALHQGIIDDAYKVQIIFDYQDKIDPIILKQAWQYAQNKYPSLRLRFSWEEELVQIVDKECELDWRYFDISKENNQEKRIEEIKKKDREEIYDLAISKLFRICLIKKNEDLYTCIFSNHHVILDGWSIPVLLKYVHETYLKLLQGLVVDTKEDIAYIKAQQYLQQHTKNNEKYWQEYLSSIEVRLDLSSLILQEKQDVRLQEYKYIKDPQNQNIVIRGELYKQLKDLTQEVGITLNAVLQYIWHKVLSIYGDSKQTIVGTTISGRNIPIDNIEQSIGLYINTLPLMVDHSKYRTVIETIKILQDDINELNSRSETNLVNLQKEGDRLFDSLFVYENYPDPIEKEKGDGNLKMVFKEVVEKTDYPLSVVAYETIDRQELLLSIRYAGELFNNDTISELLEIMAKMVEQIIHDPEANRFEHLNLQKYQLITKRWNSTEVEYSIRCIHELIEEQVEKTPDNIAVVYGDTTATYQELNEKANRLASYLRSLGVVTETPVAIVMNRSLEMIVAIIAILKAGATYIPIDPDFPKERLKYIVEDTKVLILLTQATLKESIVGLCKIVIEVNAKDFHKYSELNHTNSVSIKNLAYIIYTSGSTGIPKGVMITHESLNNYIQYSKSKYDIANGKVILHSSIAFDMSITSIFLPLVQGDTIEIIAEGNELEDLQNKLQSEDTLNMVKLTPTHLKALRENVNGKILSNKAKLIIGGESLSWEDIKPWLNDHRKIFNEYGPTETTVGCCVYEINHLDSRASVSIGKPIDNMKIYILDKKLNPVPIGVRGEIYISGIGLARGYLNRADLTAERFFANPFTVEGERLYKTGDLGRYLINGNIEYLGRNDEQVKIRGYRIELGEIEAVLNKHRDISAAVVIEKEQETTKSLVAYVVLKELSEDKRALIDSSGKEFNICAVAEEVTESLGNTLARVLPEYMIPKYFVYLNRIPLTSNGKLDRRALPEPEVQSQDSYIAPRTELEKQLCDIWAQVLKLEKISITDNFFRIGGDSILAIKLVSKLNQELLIPVEIKDIFSSNNILALVQYLESKSLNNEELYCEKWNFKC
ncbi:non-ribosomal peptide synthetase [Candidatus Megaera polyxenophila]|nr:non-ribosomal peptide synthetase [Candidatus Megaera polyxenophila]